MNTGDFSANNPIRKNPTLAKEHSMSEILKGNFKTKNPVAKADEGEKTLEDKFEKEALKRLGGSIAFVSKKKVMWDAKDTSAKKSGNDK